MKTSRLFNQVNNISLKAYSTYMLNNCGEPFYGKDWKDSNRHRWKLKSQIIIDY